MNVSIKSIDDKDRLNIFHIDMDAFYAAVEEQDNPELIGKPVIVGGNKRSGIVTTANYPAREYGIHSAMPIFMARQRCPHGKYLPTRKDRYKEVSDEVFGVLYDITQEIEPVSIDEAYIDISNIGGDPVNIANYMKKKVKEKTGLTMSVGISYNKFLAKLASDWKKPDGITIIDESMIPDILLPMKVGKIHGVGPKSAERLNSIGLYTIEDLYNVSEDFLEEFLGKSGKEVYSRIRGIDNRKIRTDRVRKSLGTERTFKDATMDKDILIDYLKRFSKEISKGLKKRKLFGRTVSVKIKYNDFKVKSRSKTLMNEINDEKIIFNMALELLDEIEIDREIRLIGLTLSNLSELGINQLSLFNKDG